MACAWLAAADESEDFERPPEIPLALRGRVEERAWHQVAQLVRTGVQSPVSTSMGRLFAVGALCGLRAHANYEGQAAIELEAACDPTECGRYPISLIHDGELIVIDPREMIHLVSAEIEAGVTRGVVASRFHASLSRNRGGVGLHRLHGGQGPGRALRGCVPEPAPARGGDGRCARGGPTRDHTRTVADRRRRDLPWPSGDRRPAHGHSRMTAPRTAARRMDASAVTRQPMP